SLEQVGKSAGVFNLEKLDWLNFQYLKGRTPVQLASDVRPFIEARGLTVPGDDAWLARMVPTLQERAKTLAELVDLAHYFLSDDLAFEEKAARNFLPAETLARVAGLAARLESLPEWTPAEIERAFEATLEGTGKALGFLAQPVRVALT